MLYVSCLHLPFVCLFFVCVAAAFLVNKDEYKTKGYMADAKHVSLSGHRQYQPADAMN